MVYAMWLADNHNAEVIVLHVVLPGTGDLDIPVISAGETMRRVNSAEEILEIFVDTSKQALLEMYQPRNPQRIKLSVKIGAAVHELAQTVKDDDIDIVVMGTRGKHNRLDDFFGSITTAALRKCTVPVFVIPEKIRTPGMRNVGFATDLNPADAVQIWKAGQILAPCHPIMRVVHVATDEDKSSRMSLDELKDFMSGRQLALQLHFHEIKGGKVEEELRAFVDEYQLDLLVFHAPQRNLFERLGHHSLSRNLALFSSIPLLSVR
jgi:nucleotide-binding universal stress UspA family protein